MKKVHPIVLAGGSGTRLWPLSRKSYPKQFVKVLDEKSLFQQAAERALSTDYLEFADIVTITNSDYRFIVAEQLQNVGIDPGCILIEPKPKNTAAAIIVASLLLQANEPGATLLVIPSDHIIPDIAYFHQCLSSSLEHVRQGNIVTFGILPTRVETGYGYLKLGEKISAESNAYRVVNFFEKPNASNAQKMICAGDALWNAGIFLFNSEDMIRAFKKLAPDILKQAEKALKSSEIDLGFLRLNAEAWDSIENISIDYLIMQKIKNLVAIPFDSNWSDLGTWNAVWSESEKDRNNNAISAGAHVLDCSNSLLRTENESQQIFGIGLEDIVAIAMPDAVLVAKREHSQKVKQAVDQLISKNINQAEIFPKDHRPWGWFESLVIGDKFQVKKLYVKSGAELSLQSHQHRSEHWVVVAGIADVTVGEDVNVLVEGQSIYVPLGATHRLKNTQNTPLVVIEVQIGSYLGEDDIVRYEDIYSRAK